MKKSCTTCKLERIKCVCPNGFTVSQKEQDEGIIHLFARENRHRGDRRQIN